MHTVQPAGRTALILPVAISVHISSNNFGGSYNIEIKISDPDVQILYMINIFVGTVTVIILVLT